MKAGDLIANRFHLVDPLGSGGIGTVWRAADTANHGQHVALKFLQTHSDAALARFRTEARTLASLDHPGCVGVVDHGECAQGPYIAMELVAGEPLAALRGTRLATAAVLDIATQVAEALAYAHDRGVAHRDLKPENIVLGRFPDGRYRAVLVDFGLAKLAGTNANLTATGEFLGTPGYMSPEQIRDARSSDRLADQYAFGIILFELFAGVHPFRGASTLELLMAQLQTSPPDLPPDVCPPHVNSVIRRLVKLDPSERFPNFRAVHRALLQHPTVIETAPANTKLPVAIAAALVVLLVAGLIVFAADDQPDAPPTPTTPVAKKQEIVTALTKPVAEPDPEPGGCIPERNGTFEMEHRGRLREVWVERPRNREGLVPAAALLTYRRRSVQDFALRSNLDQLLDEGFALVGPVPIDPDYVRPEAATTFGVEIPPYVDVWSLEDDRDFVLEAVKEAAKRYCLAPDQIIGAGHAEGADVLREIACEADQPFSAILLSGTADAPDACQWRAPVSVFRLVGKIDTSVPIEGGHGCWGKDFLSSDATIERLRTALSCESTPSPTAAADCSSYDCGELTFFSCVSFGGHYLMHSGYDNQNMRRIAYTVTKPGFSDPFDPEECGDGKKMNMGYMKAARPFLEQIGVLSPNP